MAGTYRTIICGTYKGMPGAIQGDYVKPLYVDVELKADGEWTADTDKDSTLFLYIVQGEGCFEPDGEKYIAEKHAILFNGGDTLRVKATGKGVRFLLMSGKSLKEPIAWGGPIVMNTKEELDQAFRELDEGNFIK